jgi:hypothetical protein
VSSFNFIRNNIAHVGTYALLDWLEQHFKTPIHDNERLKFKSNITLSTPPSDVHSIKEIDNQIQITFNNIGFIGIQGGMSLYVVEEVLNRMQLGDTVLPDFMDIFNHRAVEIMYRLRKITYLYYHPNPAKILHNFIDSYEFDSKIIRTHKNGSRYFIKHILKRLFGSKIQYEIHNFRPEAIKIHAPLKLGQPKLNHNILGKVCMVHSMIVVIIYCLEWDLFYSLVYCDLQQKLQRLLAQKISNIKLEVTLNPACRQKAQLGFSKLNCGIVI